MITIMTKNYNSPMLQVVSIKHNDIITDSTTVGFGSGTKSGSEACAPGARAFDEWYEGY